MSVILAVFAGVVGIIIGSYWMFVVRVEERSRAALRQRLSVSDDRPTAYQAVIKEVARLSRIPVLNTLLTRAHAVSGPLQLMLEQANLRLTVGLFVLISACGVLLGYVVVWSLTGLWLVSLLVGLVAGAIPYLYVRHVRKMRLLGFEEQFPEAIDLIARALRAGHAFTTGLGMVADELAKPVGPEFKLLYEQQNYGMSLNAALRDFARRVPLLDARFFVTAVLTQRESGGNLAEVLDNLGSVIRERFRVKRQVRVATAHGRITGWVLVCFPPCLAAGFFVISPDNVSLLITDPLGVQMVVTAVILQVVGTLIIKKLVNVEY